MSGDGLNITVDLTHPELVFTARLRAFELELRGRMPEFLVPVHLCLGQEEVPAALHECLEPQDWLYSTHRNHGHYLAKGGSEQKLLDEIAGLESGVNHGWAGSQCFSDPSINFHASAVVGGLFGVAVGTALAFKLDRRDAAVVCCFGDGATEQGVFWESVNFAALHRLPIAFICENNDYSVHTRQDERQARPLQPRVEAFGIVCADRVSDAVAIARGNGGASFYEHFCEREANHVGEMPDYRVEQRP